MGQNEYIKIKELSTKEGDSPQQDTIRSIQSKPEFNITDDWYKAVIQTTTDGFFLFDLEGNILDVNDAYCSMTGYSREELISMKIFNLNIEFIEAPKKYRQRILKYKKEGGAYFEAKHKRKDGQVIDVAVSSKYLDMESGIFFCFHRNITEEKKLFDQLTKSEQKYRDLYDNAPVAYYSVGNDGFIKGSNKEAQDWLGYSAEEFSSMQVFNINAEESKPKARLLFERFKQGQLIKDEELVYQRKDKQKVYGLLSVNPIVDSYGKVVVSRSVVKDITELKKVEQNLKKSQTQLRNLSARLQQLRDEERKNIARRIHDELGQLLTALKMDLSWLKKQTPRGSETLLNKIEEMLKLVDLSVQIVKGISTELKPGLLYDIGFIAAIEWQLEQFQKLTGIQYLLKSTPKQIVLDQDLAEALFGIFQELITNTVRHADATRVSTIIKKQDDSLVMTVKDNGKGATEQQINDPKSLGLIGVRERAYFLGGKVIINGVPNKGTTIVVTIPLNKKVNDEDTHRR